MKLNLKKQQGLNLIELMISIVIGMLISLMVVQYLSTSARLFKQQGLDTTLEANGSFAISYLSQFIRQAGTRSPMWTDDPFYVGNCTSPSGSGACTKDGSTFGDQIAVQMFSQNRKDCVGNDVPDSDTDADDDGVDDGLRIANVFYVNEKNSVSSLYCRGYDIDDEDWLGTEEVALIDGVDRMEVLYGVSNEAGLVDKYVEAAAVVPQGATATEIEVRDAWNSVRSVKVALLVSDREQAPTERTEANSYTLLDSDPETFNDNVLRKVYTTTITLFNKLP